MSKDLCCYCHQEFEQADLRSYGPDRASACFDCAMSPEHKETTDKYVLELINRLSDSADDEMIVLTDYGPVTMKKGQA